MAVTIIVIVVMAVMMIVVAVPVMFVVLVVPFMFRVTGRAIIIMVISHRLVIMMAIFPPVALLGMAEIDDIAGADFDIAGRGAVHKTGALVIMACESRRGSGDGKYERGEESLFNSLH